MWMLYDLFMKKIISLLILIILVTGGFYVFTNKVLNSPIKNSGDQKSFSSVILEDIPANIDESEGSNDYRLVKINKDGSRKVVIEKLRETLQEDARTLFILHKYDNMTAYVVSSFDVIGLDEEGLNPTIEVNHSFFKIDLNTGAITESDNQDGVFGDYKQSEIL